MVLILVISIIVLLTLLGLPLFLSIGALGTALWLSVDPNPGVLQIILIEMNRLATMPILVALPLFTMTGFVLTASKMPDRMLAFLDAAAGWLPGGSAIAALCACAFFTAMTGASGVTIIAMGAVLYPILKNRYDERFSLGLLTTGGSLGLLFPPSLPIILYGVVAQIDITRIFKATLLPGILLLAVLCAYAFLHARRLQRKDLRQHADFSWRAVKAACRASVWDFLLVLLILTGVYGGFVTIAEVSAVVLIYVLAVECFLLREIHWRRQLPGIMVESAILTGAIILILGMALGFTAYLVDARIPDRVIDMLTGFTRNKYLFLAGLNLMLIVVGCIMDIFSAIVIVVPIVAPVALSYGIDPFHLSVVFLVNLEIGYSTPPVGMNLFIASLKFERPVGVLYRASLPYLVLLMACLIVVTYLPALALF
ncbi:MAG: TRAP transporter large permease [Desulfobacteraceae bacterium]|nr:MAG: TRAP transporter large permease [Desulfobacteraceae bacterium]